MINLHAYLNFNGNCEEAFRFYETVFDRPIESIVRFGDTPEIEADDNVKNLVMHTSIKINDSVYLMGSDTYEGFGPAAKAGTATYVMIDCNSEEDAHRIYDRLTQGGEIEMPLGPQPWANLYSSFKDKYGICWMIHYYCPTEE